MTSNENQTPRLAYRAMRMTLEAAVLLVAAVNALVLMLVSEMTCDDACSTPQYADSWRDLPDSWQWDAVSGLGVLSLGCAVASVVAARRDGSSIRLVAVLVFATGVTALAAWGLAS